MGGAVAEEAEVDRFTRPSRTNTQTRCAFSSYVTLECKVGDKMSLE